MPANPDLIALYQDFDPAEPLSQGTLDQFVARTGESAATICEDLQLGLGPRGKWVITGSVGCGKSSELVKLADLLHRDYALVPLDLPNSVARVDLLQPAEIVFLIGAATVKAAHELWGHEIAADSQERLVAAFQGLVEDRHVDVHQVFEGVALFLGDLALPGAGKLAATVTKSAGQARKRRRPAELGGKTRPRPGGLAGPSAAAGGPRCRVAGSPRDVPTPARPRRRHGTAAQQSVGEGGSRAAWPVGGTL